MHIHKDFMDEKISQVRDDILNYMFDNGITIGEYAKMVGVSELTLRDLLSGKRRPRIQSLKRMREPLEKGQ